MVGSFYDAELDEGCAFEELICFHGGLGGPQTRPFILYPPTLDAPARADHRRRGGPRRAARLARPAAVVALSGAGAGSDSGPAPLSPPGLPPERCSASVSSSET